MFIEKRLVLKLDKTHCINPKDEDKCWNCEKRIDCEECEDLSPIVCDEYETEDVIMNQIVLCGIPIGNPYKVKAN